MRATSSPSTGCSASALPWFAANLSMLSMVPMFFYEVPLGLWFLIRGVRAPSAAAARTGS
jgi:hypothetical protein